jgi:acetylornithine deacetylase/succinyl-diaminopimelate desuccinylase-like protein
MKLALLTILSLLFVRLLPAQDSLDKIGILKEYLKFVAIPDETGDSANIPLNAAFIRQMLLDRGVRSELFSPETGNPAVFGEVKVPGATKTIIFYAHYDGQPVNPKQWASGLEPFKPVYITAPIEKGGKIIDYKPGDPVDPSWRLSGRASADDKAGVMCIINAYGVLVKKGLRPGCNIKFFFEGEEEKGSPHLAELFRKYKDRLTSDLWVVCDGPRYVTGQKSIVFGVRGDVNVRLTVYGPKRPLHSGNYGNWAPNPGLGLAQLLASMKDEQGRVLIKGFYDDVIPPSEAERAAIRKMPEIEDALKKELDIPTPEGGTRSLIESILLPTLNINGMSSGNTGAQAANVIPTRAEAVLDLRLVPGNDVERQVQKLVSHIAAQGYHVISGQPTEEERARYPKLIQVTHDFGYNSQRTPMDLPVAQSVIKAVQGTVAYPLVLIPSAGGSLPLFVFEKELGAKVITIPLVNYDNNQHAENENVRISYLWEGIETIGSIMRIK